MKEKLKKAWGISIRIIVTFGILSFFAWTLDWNKLGQQFAGIRWGWMALAVAGFGVALSFTSLRWWTLLKVQEVFPPLKTVMSLTLIGQFFNSFLPGAVGGDVIKIFYILKYAPHRKARAALSILMDRVMGVCVLLTLSVATFPWQAQYFARFEELRAIMWTLAGLLGMVIIGILLMILVPFRRAPESWKHLWKKIPKHDVFESLMEGFRHHAKTPRLTLTALGWCLAVHASGFFVGWCLAQSLHLEASYFQVMIILAVVYILMNLPVSISGHGMREFGAVLMFSVYGIITVNPVTHAGQEPAIAFSLLLFACNLFWGLIGGLIYLTFQHHEKSVTANI